MKNPFYKIFTGAGLNSNIKEPYSYEKSIIELSGEALAGEKKTGFDEATCIGVAKQVKQLVDDGIQVAS